MSPEWRLIFHPAPSKANSRWSTSPSTRSGLLIVSRPISTRLRASVLFAMLQIGAAEPGTVCASGRGLARVVRGESPTWPCPDAICLERLGARPWRSPGDTGALPRYGMGENFRERGTAANSGRK